ncbi:hypothetical protein Rcae01_00369 [Novipirellula caenicola]|uniref:Uncharacterized protein n=1 Tax=Novipirellula caenicola TaxID=1536901 RepID=A0ABP9VI89_9BACT
MSRDAAAAGSHAKPTSYRKRKFQLTPTSLRTSRCLVSDHRTGQTTIDSKYARFSTSMLDTQATADRIDTSGTNEPVLSITDKLSEYYLSNSTSAQVSSLSHKRILKADAPVPARILGQTSFSRCSAMFSAVGLEANS